MIAISVKADISRTVKGLDDIANKQMPFAIATALNDIAFQVQRGERDNIQKVFRHPRAFTVNSVQVDKADRRKQVAVVRIRDEVAKYLAPYEFGGVHVLPGPALLNPKSIRLDQYGQLTKGTPARLKSNPDVFIATIKGITGFWRRSKRTVRGKVVKKVKLLLRFGSALPVKEHLNFHVRAAAIVKANFVGAFKIALAKTLATARKP
jgi:hypothetical protein